MESVAVTLRGKPVARLLALNKNKLGRLVDDPAFGMWADREDMKDVDGGSGR